MKGAWQMERAGSLGWPRLGDKIDWCVSKICHWLWRFKRQTRSLISANPHLIQRIFQPLYLQKKNKASSQTCRHSRLCAPCSSLYFLLQHFLGYGGAGGAGGSPPRMVSSISDGPFKGSPQMLSTVDFLGDPE